MVDEWRHLEGADSNLSEMYAAKPPFRNYATVLDWVMPQNWFWGGFNPYMVPNKISLCDFFELLVKY